MAPERGGRRVARAYAVLALAGTALLSSLLGGDGSSLWAFGVPQSAGAASLRLQQPLAGHAGRRRELTRHGVGAEEKAKAAPAKTQEVLSSPAQATVNLVKNIVGAGMLSLPAGVAAYSSSPKALIPASVLTLVFGVLSAYGFVLIADACNRTGQTTYQDTWAKSVGKSTSFVPLVACLAKASIGCVCFQMILGDCLSLILDPLGLPAIVSSRSTMILALTSFVLFPLCCLKSLAPLAKFSILGVLSNVYIAFFVVLRALDGSYKTGSTLLKSAPLAPEFHSFAGSAWATLSDPGTAVLLSILSTAFLAHYNAPLFYEQLAPNASGNKANRFLAVSVLGFSGAAIFFSLVMAGGFATFGASSMGLILNNYSPLDTLASLARGAIALSLVTAYPLVFFSLRKLVVTFLGKRGEELNAKQPKLLTATLMCIVTIVALKLRDLGTLAALAGACFGSFLIYIAPAMMVIAAQRRGIGPPMKGVSGWVNRIVQVSLIPLGIALAVIGASQSLK